LPDVVGNLTRLQTLSLQNNQLSDLPDVVGNLTRLQTLSLQNNQLSDLPDVVGNLTRLQTLSLQNNQLTNVPNTLARIAHDGYLDLNGNPLYPEISAVAEQGQGALAHYLQVRAEDEIALHEAKLVLVGEGEVGKSSLLAALRGEAWVEERVTTHGIEIKEVSVSGPAGREEITLKGWDFGGQPIYRSTHQLFFSAPAIYLIVWKPREGPNQSFVQYWIELIKRRTYDEDRPDQRPRVIVVATHGGPKQRQPHIDEQQLRTLFGDMIEDFHQVDSKTGEGIPELKEMIAKIANDIPQVGRTVPASSKHTIERVQARSQTDPYISYQAYEALCEGIQVDKALAKLYAAILNELGYCIHYADDEKLRDVMILKADWLTKAISFVLEDDQTNIQNGLATHERLSQLWSDPARPLEEQYVSDVHPLFLRLMERFDLSYRVELEGAKPTSLIAQLVPGKRPDAFDQAWPEALAQGETERVQVCRIIDAHTNESVQVDGLFYQLIVRFHRYSLGVENYERSIHWQNGLLLDDSYNGRAFVEQIRSGIRVTVRAAYPERFLHDICRDVQWLIDTMWKGLDCQITVPCPTTECPGLFEVERLTIDRSKGREEYPCRVCGEWYPIDGLLAAGPPLPTVEVLHDEVLNRLDELNATVKSGFQSTSMELRRLLSQTEERFDELMTALTDEASEGPRLFSLVPVSSGGWARDRWATQKVRLILWCEHSRLPVPILSGDASQGVYEIEQPRAWLVKIGPYARFAANALSLALPVAGVGIKLSLDDQVYQKYANDLDLSLNSFSDLLGAAKSSGESMGYDESIVPGSEADGHSGVKRLPLASQNAYLAESAKEYGDLNRLDGAPLRELQVLLKKKDPGFGGLERVQDNRRRFLWVHPEYKKIYSPDLPEFPTTV
ncbi:MAG: COR domain-containing protein, partial [Chloroflexota bacterium]